MEDVITRLRRHPVKRFDKRTLGQIKYLVIQHSVLPGDFPPERIANYLVEKKQWPGIGYHFYITSDGTIYQTNRLETVCYFAGSNVQYNPLGVCICFAGNFTAEVPTPAQLISGGKLLAFLMQELHLPMENIRGHKEFVVTQSPGNQWDSGQKWKDMLLAEVRAAQA
jgi:N-acetyl-anhydromuramyl-L-alanine amidase AmpD